MHEKIKIAIADDHTLFVNGLVSLLTKYPEIEVVIVAENGKALHDKLETIQPDILLLDLEMPVMDGYKTAAMLKKNYPDIKIIILTFVYKIAIISILIASLVNLIIFYIKIHNAA